MFKKILSSIQNLTLADKYLAGVALAILINPTLAIFAAAGVLTYFIYKIGKEVLKEE